MRVKKLSLAEPNALSLTPFSGVEELPGNGNRVSGFRYTSETAEPGCFTMGHVAQAFQPAVPQVFNLQCLGGFQQLADWKQAESLRYLRPTVQHFQDVKYAGSAVLSVTKSKRAQLKRGFKETGRLSIRMIPT